MQPDIQAHFVLISLLIIDFGMQNVGMPHVRPLEGKLWQMRMKGKDGIARAVYEVQTGQHLIVLHVFCKNTQTTPRRAIATAFERLKRITP
ncbi:MAG: type II toxin-antitoxin system RelE/ParE family toxin [Halothiobacillus sp.]|nr:type II toxin-antitoxin system RelE/ParE family toxin [Halothiobacillus sp.]